MSVRKMWPDREPLTYSSSRPWVVPDFVIPGLRRGEVGILAAAGATGKSYLLQQFCMSLAAGVQIFSFLPVSKPLRVCLVNFEDMAADMTNRGNAILQVFPAMENASLQHGLHSFALPGETINLVHQVHGEMCVNGAAVQAITSFCTGFDLIVLDPMSAIFSGDENSQRDANLLMQTLRRIAVEANAAIVLAHHVSKTSMWQKKGDEAAAVRGAGAFIFSARCVMNLSKGADSGDGNSRLYLTWTKLNNCAPIPPVSLFRGGRGVLVESENEARRSRLVTREMESVPVTPENLFDDEIDETDEMPVSEPGGRRRGSIAETLRVLRGGDDAA